MGPAPGSESPWELARKALATMASGALATLDAHFYTASGRPFYQVVLEDPAAAYREASRVIPESMVRLLFKELLRRLSQGAAPYEIDEALRRLEEGDGSKFATMLGRGGHVT